MSRHKLIEVLKSRGCGKIMLKAIQAMYKCTKNVLKAAVINSTIGVRQGAPSSCLLFVIYINEMIKMIKNAIVTDGFLGCCHALLLMDDTVILATNREMCEAKLKIVIQYCQEFGMSMNTKKTKFFVINGNERDKAPFEIDGIKIDYICKYLYLGAWFTDSGKISDVIALHEKSNQATINKFSIFCAANKQMPFKYKKLVFEAAVTASLLYSAESWFTDSIKPIEQQYNQLVRCLLGVRRNTSIDLCLIESGITPIRHVLTNRRATFIKSKLLENDSEQPFIFAFRLSNMHSTTAYRFMSKCIGHNPVDNPYQNLVNSVYMKSNHGTKMNTYVNTLNTAMSVHPIYTTNVYIPDYQREAFTRLRLMSHNLRIETGRWSRIPPERRVCPCDNTQPQTESHVLIDCTLTENIRLRYSTLDFSNVNSLLNEATHLSLLCKYVHEVLNHV